jgi:hypothetical protein
MTLDWPKPALSRSPLPKVPPPDKCLLFDEGYDFAECIRPRAMPQKTTEDRQEAILAHCPWPIYSREGRAWCAGVNRNFAERRCGIGIKI